MSRLQANVTHAFVGLTLFVSVAAFATELATLTGYVTDPTGLRVPHAKIQLTNVDTNVTYFVETNDLGLYRVPSLPPGSYRLILQKEGFKTIVKQNIELHVQDISALNFQMELGSIAESVTVESGGPLVNTQDASVSTVIDHNFTENLPLNGRSFQTLIQLTPGAVLTPTFAGSPGQFSINGQRADANYFSVDGVSANIGISVILGLGQSAAGSLPGFNAQGGTNSLVSVDALQEFRVQTSSFAPEFGRSPGGQVSILTRSGTNAFHGTLFDYFRNDALDAGDWFNGFNHAPPLVKAKERQNDFGGVLGGPVVKDRTFFFFSYEGLRLRQPFTAQLLVPDLASRQLASPGIQPLLNAFPIPNGPTVPGGLARFSASYSNPSTLDAYSIRADQVFNSRLVLFGRYNYSPSDLSVRGISSLSYVDHPSVTTQTLTLGLTAALSPSVSNDFRANYSNVKGTDSASLDDFAGAVPLPSSIMFPAGQSLDNSGFEIVLIGAGNSTSGGNGFLIAGKELTNEQRQINFLDNFSVTAGAHQMKIGIDYRWIAPITSPSLYSLTPVFFGVAGGSGSALSGAPFLTQIKSNQSVALLSRNISLYGQDTWKLTSRLVVTYGIRWDINPALAGKNTASTPFTVQGLETPVTVALAPKGTPLYATSYGNVAPRLGITYQVGQKHGRESVIRGGVGIFYDYSSGFLGSLTTGFPFSSVKNLFATPFPLSAQQAAPPTISQNLPTSSALNVAVPDLKLPRTYQWNAAAEQALGTSSSLSLTYVGSVGRKLLRQYALNAPNSSFLSQIFVTNNTGTSDYHALQAQFQRRMSRNVQALASYTFAHSIDNASNDSLVFTPQSLANPDIDRGSSDFDVRHSLTGALTYEIPAPTGKSTLRLLASGWAIDDFLTTRSALPIDVIGTTVVVGGTRFTARPDVVPGLPLYLYGSQYPGGKALNNTPNQAGIGCKGPFCPAPAGKQGTLSRNSLRGFGAWQDDFTLRKQGHLTENLVFQFRAEFFNVFNHPNFGSPGNSLASALFGQSTQTLASSLGSGGATGGFSPLYQMGSPRSIQLALKLQF